jgi:3-oxoacyl-[acyl-carrier-protein] synthase-3
MNLEESKVLMNIEKYGNTTPYLPLVLNDFEHLLKRNTIILLIGGGLLGIYLFKMGIRQNKFKLK